MPGLITHQRIFLETVKSLKKQKHPHYAAHLLDVQFCNPVFTSSALAGLLSPNLFDYLPFQPRQTFLGNHLKHILHSDEGLPILYSMFSSFFNNTHAEPNEWSLCQKGFFYGLISHWVVDAVYHPFVLYWSGFPTYRDNRDAYYRNQHLLFEYTIDAYMAYYYHSEPFDYNLHSMLPQKNSLLYNSVKTFLSDAVAKHHPSLRITVPVISWFNLDLFDLAMKCVAPVYKMKKSANPTVINIMRFLEKRKYSDFFVRYPNPKRINRHILNLHRERWFVPTGEVGLHYESVDDLFKTSKEKTVLIWKQCEELFTNRVAPAFTQFSAMLEYTNAYTGKKGFSLGTLQHTHPLRLHN